jgi:non-ribosomal peptide synthetase-like protein
MNLPRDDVQADAFHSLLWLFERAARGWPESIAVDLPASAARPQRLTITYRALEQQANNVAQFLRGKVSRESVVAILLPRGHEHLYASHLAVLKSGAAFVCIDISFPDEQIREILNDSGAVILLTSAAGVNRARSVGVLAAEHIHDIGMLRSDQPEPVDANFTFPNPAPNDLAYLIYTSGTTGKPKGILIEHGGIANLISYGLDEFKLTPGDRCAQISSPAYDSWIEEVWMAFAAGATVVPMDDHTVRLGPDLVTWLRDERLTVITPPPTLLRSMACADPKSALPELRLIYAGGEALTSDLANSWARGRRFVNGYGPTECSVTCTRIDVRPGDEISIGKPIPGMNAWALDESLNEVSDGVSGELCMGGIGLARGYHHRFDLTEQKFPTHPQLGRIYRTGDLVHRDGAGNFFYHGRSDSQVKLRGYRIELEAIESCLNECLGVRASACKLQGDGPRQAIVAFVVAENGNGIPAAAVLRATLQAKLPPYMVPSSFAEVSQLPTTIGGKLDRQRLPDLELEGNQNHTKEAPRSDLERTIAEAAQSVLHLGTTPSIYDDFFIDCGGESLLAAQLISLLRHNVLTSGLTVRDVYEARTIAGLAACARVSASAAESLKVRNQRAEQSQLPALIAQTVSLLALVMIITATSYILMFELVPRLLSSLGLFELMLLAPVISVLGIGIYVLGSVTLLAATKWLLIGRYTRLRTRVWSAFYVRNWIVQQVARLVPWRILAETVFQHHALRLLGARIGQRVHISRGVNLLGGGWDLLDIGDDVSIGRDVSISLVQFDDGDLVVGPVTLGERSTLEVRASVSANGTLEPESYLSSLSSLTEGERIPQGERWTGVPAEPGGQAPPKATLSLGEKSLKPFAHGVVLIGARALVGLLLTLAVELPFLLAASVSGVDTAAALSWLSHPTLNAPLLILLALMVAAAVPCFLLTEAVLMRVLLKTKAGTVSCWSWSYVRAQLKMRMLESAGDWLSGTILWPLWLRAAGMRVGRSCEISTIIDVVPELIRIGDESFLADGIYLGGPTIHRGRVTLSQTSLAKNTFIGNHAVIPGGQQLPPDILIGICTVASDEIESGSSWFGLPAFRLPRREVINLDRRLTHHPSAIRYLNRVFWELLRFTLPIPIVLVDAGWYALLVNSAARVNRPVLLLLIAPLLTIGVGTFFVLFALALKWLLLGKVRSGSHPLWSCWCSRWDFLYVAWNRYAAGILLWLEGTPLLIWYLRAMGMHIGRGVVLGPGFSQVVDPDMLCFEDGSTVSCQFQAHTFEDRVLKIDRITIREGATVGSEAVLLYGAEIGARTTVASNSVVMKRETLLPDHYYAGCPVELAAGKRD